MPRWGEQSPDGNCRLQSGGCLLGKPASQAVGPPTDALRFRVDLQIIHLWRFLTATALSQMKCIALLNVCLFDVWLIRV